MAKLVIVRHGESIWNLENRFTGWTDVCLSQNGIKQAKKAGELLKNYKFDLAFTSKLMRAQETLYEILNVNKHCFKFIRIHEEDNKYKDWYSNFTHTKEDDKELKVRISISLNERYYGDLQGLNKDAMRKKYGNEKVFQWRRSFDTRPPGGECLKDTYERTIPYFENEIIKELKIGKNILISAHGNSLRAIVMYLEKISGDEIMKHELTLGVPYVYEFSDDLKTFKKEELK